MTISYANRLSGTGGRKHDMLPVSKLVIANYFLKNIGGFSIGDKAIVEYSPNQIIIKKI